MKCSHCPQSQCFEIPLSKFCDACHMEHYEKKKILVENESYLYVLGFEIPLP